MTSKGTHVVTGAYGFTGKYIAHELLDRGYDVRTLTHSPNRPHPFGDQVPAASYSFDDTDKLTSTLSGADVLYNTYWVRFDYSDSRQSFGHEKAIRNSAKLFHAAKQAGVNRIVHVSVSNAAMDSPLPYYHGKARIEHLLQNTDIPHSILRPTLLFETDNLLVNNIAWLLRNLPVFGVFGTGKYRLEPISVKDFASVAVNHADSDDNIIQDTVGPESLTYNQLVTSIKDAIGCRCLIVHVPDSIGLAGARLIGLLKNDVTLTKEEVLGLKHEYLHTGSDPVATTRFTDWVAENASSLGTTYENELDRRRHYADKPV